MGSEGWEWVLWASERLEKIWPCWIPFLAGLSLFAVLRTWFTREQKSQRANWSRELEKSFELWQKKRRANGTGGTKSNGA